MECFNMNQRSIINNFTKMFREELKETLSEQALKNFNFSEPVYLTSDSIKTLIDKLNKDQKLFKNFLLSYNKLSNRAKVQTLIHFCPLNAVAAEKYMRTVFPHNKQFKTPFFVGSPTLQFKSMANVYTKKGVTLNTLKTYKPKEIEDLINSGKIIISYFDPYGKTYFKKKVDFVDYTLNMLNLTLNPTEASDRGKLIQKANSNQIVNTLLENVNLTHLQNFYKKIYVPIYKNCLNYLYKCTEFSTNQENENLRKLQEEIENFPQRFEQNKTSKEEISKLISDTGRE